MTNSKVYDLIGIGFGPANVALAIALEEEADANLRAVFLEKSPVPQWQENMLLTGSDIQHHPVRDLVSLRNPRSRYSFINYLHENRRLIEHLNLPTPFPLRTEYADYVSWVRRNLTTRADYGVSVVHLGFDPASDLYQVTTSAREVILAQQISLGPGRSPLIPGQFAGLLDSRRRVVHLTDYLPAVRTFDPRTDGRIGIVGGSQSAVELALDIRRRFPSAVVDILTRSWSLRAKDHSPFSEEVYTPGFTDYYHGSSKAARRRLDRFTRPTNYSAADLDVLERLYVELYEDKLGGRVRTRIYGDTEILDATTPSDDTVVLATRNATTGEHDELVFDRIVLATGFRDMGSNPDNEHHHPLLEHVHRQLRTDAEGDLVVERDYSVHPVAGTAPIYLNGLCESTHGIGDSGSFSLLSLRAEVIARSIIETRDRTPLTVTA
ncbi:SidA/IucD/PvdA family monooxygenase [Nocardia sp. alder85J]|uniref:SidA/IucD/PvdA family monooxygenase n=1 Tax=Nocardia sp. alder85J TaxID=2862949 RepID=UPI001CD520E5|nr:SidA/IucD/PvdA family monooxygenase [Nocardia sp. alder85J]MCX4091976.1 SidA/IucD/PvdA family monooxygenase [Nocardia sp. alder85J]